MTLIVSLRIPDGIVLAGDSLATMQNQTQIVADIDVKCPSCGHDHTLGQHPVAQMIFPATTFSFAQKVVPFMGKFGVGTFGQGQLAGETIYFAIRKLEQSSGANVPSSAEEAADLIGQYMHSLLVRELANNGEDINAASDTWYATGFQVVGYNGDDAVTVELLIGKTVKKIVHSGFNINCSGQHNVVKALFDLSSANPNLAPIYSLFSLQDAISYAQFLIQTTAMHQQFSRSIPGVGGEIDVALVTPFDNFRWIKQKELGKILGGK